MRRSSRLARFMHYGTRVAPVVLALSVASPALAQSSADGAAAAEALYEQAKTLMAQGRDAEACPKLEESQRLDPGTGTLLNLALCYERTKRLASAWSKYLEAASSAATSGNAQREKEARKQADRLRPHLSYVIIQVAESAKVTPGLEVRRDGQLVGSAQWGASIPADEGEHEVTASAPGRTSWRAPVVVKGEGSTTSVTVPPLAEGPPTAQTPAIVAPAGAPNDTASTTSSSGLGTQRVLALVAGGIGVVGVGVGTVFGLQAKSHHDEAEKYCDGARCTDARGVTAGNDAHAAGNVSTIAMIIGAVGIAGGVTLWFTAPRENAMSARVELGLGRVDVGGTF
jgi:tetratricopeptide (TPR) repeat protein